MTKAQLKEKYDTWARGIDELYGSKMGIFHKLQDLCEAEGDGHRWCSIEELVTQVIKANPGNAYKALSLYGKYHVIEGQEEAWRDLALATDNCKI